MTLSTSGSHTNDDTNPCSYGTKSFITTYTKFQTGPHTQPFPSSPDLLTLLRPF